MVDMDKEMPDTNNVLETKAERPWASPQQEPVKGVVQPRVIAPFGKPVRHTNKLDYILNIVLKEASKHKHVWPFLKPVDAQHLGIPHYHEKIRRPMDLKTIESRIKNVYYTGSQECVDDIETVFQNCYTFNGPEDDVTIMAQNVHAVVKKSLEASPKEEVEMEITWGKKKKTIKSGLGAGDLSRLAAGSEDHRRRKEGSAVRGSEPPSECGSEASAVHEKSSGKVGSKTMKTAPKRKAESDDDEKSEPIRPHKREVTTKKGHSVQLAGRMKFCQKMLNDFFSKKYFEMAWPFYEPVNAEQLGLHDYHKIIKQPMDMGTIKRKLEGGEYTEPSEFEADFRLMLNNCLLYNPVGDPIHMMGEKFMDAFDKKWRDLPSEKSAALAGVSTATSSSYTSSVNTFTSTAVPPPSSSTKAPKVSHVAPMVKDVAEGTKARTEEVMRLENALSMLEERESKLNAEIRQLHQLKMKLAEAKKSRIQDGSSAALPEHLFVQVRSFCQKREVDIDGVGQINGHVPGGNMTASEVRTLNGRRRKGPVEEYDFDSDTEEANTEMSYDDKRGLSILINRLPPDHLSTIVSIIERREKALQPRQTNDSEIEIDFEALGTRCLREMDAFARHILKLPLKGSTTTKVKREATSPEKQITPQPVAGVAGGNEKKMLSPKRAENENRQHRRRRHASFEMSSEEKSGLIERLEKEIDQINTCIIKSSSGRAFLNNRPSVLLKRIGGETGRKLRKGKMVDEDEEKAINISESSDSDNGRKRRKGVKNGEALSDSGTSSSSSDEDSDDEFKGDPPRRAAGLPPIGGRMVGQPAISRVQPPPLPAASNTVATTSSTAVAKNPPSQPHQVLKSAPMGKMVATKPATSGVGGAQNMSGNAGKTILDTLLPDTFGATKSNYMAQSPGNSVAPHEPTEDEQARIERLRMEAKARRQQEDENSISMTTQMEMMQSFEFDEMY